MIRIIARLYDTYQAAENTVRDLEAAGVPHSEISLMANNVEERRVVAAPHSHNEGAVGAEIGAGVGALAGGGAGLLAGLGMLAIPGVGPVVAAGWLVALAVGAVGGAAAGGLLGGLAGAGISSEDAEVYAEGIRRGGSLVSARVPDETADEVARIMDAHGPVQVSERRAAYAEAGWTGYDPAAPSYTPDQIRQERAGR